MKFLKLSVLGFVLALATQAHARTLKCSSVGEQLPQNRLVFDVTLETNWWGNAVYSGSYTYTNPSSNETGSGEFACLPANEKGVTMCGVIKPDSNITSIVSHPVMGFMIQITGQPHVVLFSCK